MYWIEEPVKHDNYAGTARISQSLVTPVQIGENLANVQHLQDAISHNAADYYMPDVQRIGGVTGWQHAAALCHANAIEMSSHLFPEFSIHLLAATPTAHWLEYVDWANPILQIPLTVDKGIAIVPDRLGAGIEWNEDAIAQFQVNF